MARAGCSFIANPRTLTAVGKAWVDRHRALGITDVRVAVTTAPDGSLPTRLLQRSADAYRAGGIRVRPQFTRGFAPVGGESPGVFPNQGLNQRGDRLSDEYIDRWSLRVTAFMHQMTAHGWDSCILWNEEDEEAILPEGTNPDPAGLKPGSMNPARPRPVADLHGLSTRMHTGA